jgi:DsbC/DsbD-like thiol-disulfide interchange protein
VLVVNLILFLAALVALLAPAAADELASSWAPSHGARARLIAGSEPAAAGGMLVAGIELALDDGWKTYWRHPGSAGGLPPRFDWTGSVNLAAADVLYPAPQHLRDAAGDTIGYKHAVVLPVLLKASNPKLPIVLSLALEYGICREICVPAEAVLHLNVPPAAQPLSLDLARALADVPRTAHQLRPADPQMKTAIAALGGSAPGLQFEVTCAPGTSSADLVAEVTDGSWLPLPKRVADCGAGPARFRLNLATAKDAAALAGKTLRLTMLSSGGASEATWTVK